jgi:hypothetical protein
MSTPSIKVGQGNWGIKAGNLLAYANTDKKFVARDFTVGRLLDTATRVNASGNIEGVLANVPRIDYFGGQASLLVEPSAINLSLNSQTWDASNNWQLSEGSGRVTVATATSGTLAPDGTSTANAISPTSGNITHYLFSNATGTISYVSGTVYTLSAFFKKGAGDSGRYVQIASRGGTTGFLGNPYANFDLELGTTLTVSGSVADSNRASRIQNYGNGWYRCSLTATCSASSNSTVGVLAALLTTDTNARLGAAFAGNTSDYIFGWGAQLEAGSVATSYIPTTTGSVTRNADVISVTGVAGLIGQTEGTIYAEVDVRTLGAAKNILQIDDGTATNRIGLFVDISPTRLTFLMSSAGVTNSLSGTVATGVIKIAASYSSGNVQVFTNGSFLVSGTIATYPIVALNAISVGSRISSGVYSVFLNDRILAAALYTTRLTDAELAALTSL